MGYESVMNYAIEKLKELFLVVGNFGGQVMDWFDKVFPPETREETLSHWFQVALPFVLAALVLIMCVCCCRLCCRGGRSSKMMKAPGRNVRMPRNVFESDPRSYFIKLRSSPGDLLV